MNWKENFLKRSLREIVRPYRWKIIFLCAMSVLQSVLQVALAVITRYVIDAAVTGKGDLAFWGVLLIADSVAMVLIYSLTNWYTGSTSDRVSAKLRSKMLRCAVFGGSLRTPKSHSGELLNRAMDDVYSVCDGVLLTIPSLAGQVTRLVATFAAVLLVFPPVALVLFLVAAAVTLLAAMVRPALKARQRAVRASDEDVMSTMQEDFQQLELIQSIGAQKRILDRFDSALRRNLKDKKRRRRWSVGVSSVVTGASQLGSGVLLLWGAARIAVGAVTFGELTSLLQLLSLFRGPVLGISGMLTRLASVEVAAERLQGLITEEEKQIPAITEQSICAVVFEDVTFSYPGDDVPVLQGFHARLPLDGWTCLTGISGRGKSTLFKLILGLYTPQTGRVYLQTPQGEIPCSEQTRSLFAYVPQDYAMFSGTVLENFQLVCPELDMSALEGVLKLAQAEFILEMPEGVQTLLGENNTGLSMGQLQRLAIARALLMERPIFLLDECTSALDAETERLVLQNLHAHGKQAILVTHRPEALENIDGITNFMMDE